MKDSSRQPEKARDQRRDYATPKLRRFGSIQENTAAGSFGPTEGNSGHTNKAPKP